MNPETPIISYELLRVSSLLCCGGGVIGGLVFAIKMFSNYHHPVKDIQSRPIQEITRQDVDIYRRTSTGKGEAKDIGFYYDGDKKKLVYNPQKNGKK